MMIILPFSNYSRFTINIPLEDTTYKFFFNWNTRGNYWVMSLLYPNDEVIINSIKIVLLEDLFSPFRYKDGVPKGVLSAIRIDEKDTSPLKDYEFYTQDSVLAYLTQEEVENEQITI